MPVFTLRQMLNQFKMSSTPCNEKSLSHIIYIYIYGCSRTLAVFSPAINRLGVCGCECVSSDKNGSIKTECRNDGCKMSG